MPIFQVEWWTKKSGHAVKSGDALSRGSRNEKKVRVFGIFRIGIIGTNIQTFNRYAHTNLAICFAISTALLLQSVLDNCFNFAAGINPKPETRCSSAYSNTHCYYYYYYWGAPQTQS